MSEIMSLKQGILTLILSISTIIPSEAQGLRFKGMEENSIDQRTSYKVFGNRRVKLTGDICISFDLCTYPPDRFGYFLRIANLDDGGRAWNLSYDHSIDSTIVLRLNEEGRFSLINATLPSDKMKLSHWYKVKLEIDTRADSVHLAVGDTTFHSHCPIEDRLSPVICFGKSEHLIEVPSFAIKNLRITDDTQEYNYNFQEHDGYTVSEKGQKNKGTVENPVWLNNNAIHWTHECKSINSTPSGATYNEVRKQVYYFSRTALTIYDMTTNTITEDIEFKTPCPVEIIQGNCWVSQDGKNLTVYETLSSDCKEFDSKRPMVATLDLDTMEWQNKSEEHFWMQMHHHCGFNNPITGRYTIFGGFGRQKYNGTFYEWNGSGWNKVWEEHSGDTIFPRYFAAAGVSEDGKSIYIYGGMGNECGDQVVGRRYYYDLHRIDPATGDTKKCWSLKEIGSPNMATVSRLIPDGEWLYAICYPESKSQSELQMYKFRISDGYFEKRGTPVRIMSDHILTNANIFLDRELMKFILINVEYANSTTSSLDVFSLSYPPLYINQSADNKHTWVVLLFVIIGILIAGISISLAILAHNRKKHQKENFDNLRRLKNKQAENIGFKPEIRSNAIYLFGDFTVLDSEKHNISSEFTPQLRLMLCLLIKHSCDGRGIESQTLGNIMWPDKEQSKVRNSRSVSINNLRILLRKMEGVRLVCENNFFRLLIEENGYCDYFALKKEISANAPSKTNILNIISRGKFLKYETNEILDSFKSESEEMALNLAMTYLDEDIAAKSYFEIIEVAEIILAFDPYQEKAMKAIIKTLKRMKRSEEALVKYSNFTKIYRDSTGEDYGVDFDSI